MAMDSIPTRAWLARQTAALISRGPPPRMVGGRGEYSAQRSVPDPRNRHGRFPHGEQPRPVLPSGIVIPVIDLGPYLAGRPGASAATAAELGRALQDV